MKTPITVAYGDGIGPEIMEATLHIIQSAGAQLDIERIEIGEKVYLTGNPTGIESSAWESLRRTKIFLKAPITTPQGGGFKSLNVTARKALGLYANVRPCVSYAPFVATKHPVMDVVIVRENEEDLYAGIEHRQSQDVISCTKLISRPGSEKIIRYAFEYARVNYRNKVTCFTKDNIMKMTDGLFHKIFDEIAAQYPDIENEHWIVDIGTAKLADTPEAFDVIVLPNLYGDILSDVAAQIAGSVGLAGSSNIGVNAAMFEAIHGSAPRRAGQNLANPSGLFLGSILMLLHIGQTEVAEKAHNAWLCVIEDGIHTYDIFKEGISKQKVGTKEFAQAVVDRLGAKPQHLKPVHYKKGAHNLGKTFPYVRPTEKRELIGVDVFIEYIKGSADDLGFLLEKCEGSGMKLEMIDNRGMAVWPKGMPGIFCSDSFRARFKLPDETAGYPFSGLDSRKVRPSSEPPRSSEEGQLLRERLASEGSAKLASEGSAKLASEGSAKLASEGSARLASEGSAKLASEVNGYTTGTIDHRAILALLERITEAGLEFLKTELLYNFDGKPGFTRGQGQ